MAPKKKAKPKKKRKKPFVVSVEDFGAKGDRLADDSEAFLAAKRTRAARIKVRAGKTYEVNHEVELDHRFISTRK